MATEGGRASARCEALARLAVEAARLVATAEADGAATPDRSSSSSSSDRRRRSRSCCRSCPGHAPWGAQADAALATVALARGDRGRRRGRRRRGIRRPSRRGSTRTPAWRSSSRRLGRCFAGAPPEVQAFVRDYLRSTLSRIAQGTADEAIRVRWLTGPVGRELVELAGPMERLGRWRRRGRGRRPGLDDDGTPAAAAPDRGPDERRDRGRARHRARRTSSSAWRACSPSSAPRAAPRRPRSRSAGSRPWGRA